MSNTVLRLGADPHLWATTWFDAVVALGDGGSYPSFTRAIPGAGAAAGVCGV